MKKSDSRILNAWSRNKYLMRHGLLPARLEILQRAQFMKKVGAQFRTSDGQWWTDETLNKEIELCREMMRR